MSLKIKRVPIGKWLNNNKFVAGLSVVLAVVIWLVVTLQMSNQMEATFSDVPVTFETTMTDELDLDMFGQKDVRVNVTVYGKRYEVSPAVLSADDFIVTVSTANVSLTGKYTLPISVHLRDETKDIEILSFAPKSVELFFDKTITDDFPVELTVKAPDDQIAADGYAVTNQVLSRKQVSITGAATEVQKIKKAVAEVELDAPLNKTTTFPNVELAIVNASGGVVRKDYAHVTNRDSNVVVTLEILKKTTITPTVHFNDTPPYFINNPISYVCSPSGPVNVAASEGLKQDSLTLGTIDFSEIKAGANTFEFVSDEIKNMRILDDIESFRVFFSIDGFYTRKISVSLDSAMLKSLPDGVRATIPDGSTLELTVIGQEYELDALEQKDFKITVDVSSLKDAEPGTVELPAVVSVNTNSCWVYGSYAVPVTVS